MIETGREVVCIKTHELLSGQIIFKGEFAYIEHKFKNSDVYDITIGPDRVNMLGDSIYLSEKWEQVP
jgi:hypothetical protein